MLQEWGSAKAGGADAASSRALEEKPPETLYIHSVNTAWVIYIYIYINILCVFACATLVFACGCLTTHQHKHMCESYTGSNNISIMHIAKTHRTHIGEVFVMF